MKKLITLSLCLAAAQNQNRQNGQNRSTSGQNGQNRSTSGQGGQNRSREELEKLNHVYPYPVPMPDITTCRFFNDSNLIGALYQHLDTYETLQ